MKNANKQNKKRKLLPLFSILSLVGVAIASPTVAAASTLPSEAVGAFAIIIPVAILLVSLVIAVWKHTAIDALPSPEQFARAQASATHNKERHT